MALHAVKEVTNSLLYMLALDLSRVMLVAAIAGVSLDLGRMARLARANARLAMVDGEGVQPVKARRTPGIGAVTLGAGIAEYGHVKSGILMAGNASLRGACEHVVHVTALARNVRVFAGQREGALAVVERRVLPGLGPVAGGAVRPELAVVLIVLLDGKRRNLAACL